MERNSKKRQSILECLRSTKSHPSAEWVYNQLKPIYPSLSLATVYRNLNQLKESGVIRSLGKINGQERFDATVAPHTHVVCSRCGKVIDVDNNFVTRELMDKIGRSTGFSVLDSDLQFVGICPECKASYQSK